MTGTDEDPMQGKEPDEESWDSCLRIAFGRRSEEEPLSVLTLLPSIPGASSQTDDPDARICGRLQLGAEIARGAVGVVYEAFDADLGRRVAVKVLHDHLLEHGELVRRFLEEAQIGAQLQHPGIVPVYDMGLDQEQRPWFAMKLVRGRSWSEILKERADPGVDLPRMLRIFAQVCQTIAYAHARGVVHRDLKPVHVMVGTFGEIQVMDWGFAKVLGRAEDGGGDPVSTIRGTADGLASMAGTALGTPAYMSPEQARGDVDSVDARSDVFALGAILCEVLTGQAPYAGPDALDRARNVDTGAVIEMLRAVDVDRQLADLAQACMQEDPEARPADGEAVALAIDAHLSGMEERARQAELAAAASEARVRGERRARRFGIALTISISVLLLLTLGWLFYRSTERSRAGREIEAAIERSRAQLEEGNWSVALRGLQVADGLVQASSLAEDSRAMLGSRVARLQARARSGILNDRILSLRSNTSQGPGPVDDYERAFKELGLVADPQAMARWGSEHSPADVSLVARALEDWYSRIGPQGRRDSRWLLAAQGLDPDPGRTAIRNAWLARDRKALFAQADATDGDTSAEDFLLLALALQGIDESSRAVSLLTSAVEAHPADLWLRVASIRLLLSQRPPQLALARLHARVAKSLHPDRGWRAIPKLPPRPPGPERGQGFQDRRLEDVRRLWERGDEIQALDRLDSFLRDHPGSPLARRFIERALRELGPDDKVLIDLLEKMKDR